METIDLIDAAADLERLVERIASGAAPEIVIARDGKPVARIVPVSVDVGRRIGIANGAFEVPDFPESPDDDLIRAFRGDSGD